jgi:hypothetical protein
MLHGVDIYAIRYAAQKISFMLHAHKFKMTIMCFDMHEIKKLILMLYFVHKNKISSTTMQLGSL